MTEVFVNIPKFSQLSSRVWRVLGLNPGKFTLQGTNTYILGAGPQKILLDCGQGIPEYLPLLQTSLKDTHPDAYISDIIISHGHSDHWGGLSDILSCTTLNHNNIKVHKFPVPQGHHVHHMQDFPAHLVPSISELVDKQVFTAQDVTLKTIYTPGHCKDHCTFWLEEEKSIFTADCVLGQGTAVFDDLAEYIEGLQNLIEMKPTRLYPGHGPVVENGLEKIQEYVKHRLDRENQIVSLLMDGTRESWSPIEIVEVLYKGYPESLHLPAANSVVLHLYKLQKDQRATTVTGHKADTLTMEYNMHNALQDRWLWIDTNTMQKNNL